VDKLEFEAGDLRLARAFVASIRARHPGHFTPALIHDLLAKALAPDAPARMSDDKLASAMEAMAKQAGYRGSGEIEPGPDEPKKKPPV
jgi:hypothetical protein